MSAVLVAFLLGLLLGLACNRRAVTRRSEVIRWAGEDIERYAPIVEHVEATEEKCRRAMALARKAMHRAGSTT